MPCYFIAISLPDESKDCLLSIQPTAFPDTRLVGRTELHLTLHYLGEVSDRSCELARCALKEIKTTEFTITIKGLGLFSAEGRPKVLWSGVEKDLALESIHRSIGDALTCAIGFQPENRPYFPHVSLVRFNGPCSPDVVESYVDENKDFNISAIPVKQFTLYSSVFVDGVPEYDEVAVFSLLEN